MQQKNILPLRRRLALGASLKKQATTMAISRYWATRLHRDCRIFDNDWSGGSTSRFSACKKD